jgi:hypothetical protein
MVILENALILLLRLSGLGDFDSSRTSNRRFFCAGPAGAVLTLFFFFLVGSGINAPGTKSESESTSVVCVAEI